MCALQRIDLQKYITRTIFITVLGAWIWLLFTFPPRELIDKIGAANGYLIMFALAFIGGLSTFSSTPYHLILFMLAAAGLNPVWLGLLTGAGVILGDSTSYLIGYTGQTIIPPKANKFFHKIYEWCKTKPSWVIPLFLFLYGALVPFSNDFIVISLGLARYPFLKLMLPLGLGNMIFNTALAYAGSYSMELFK